MLTVVFLNGEAETARVILRELVNSTVGFEELALETSCRCFSGQGFDVPCCYAAFSLSYDLYLWRN